jgi:hypothetical protein
LKESSVAERKPRDERSPRWRERLAVLFMAFFPLLVAGGFLAPGVVRVLAIAQELDESERAAIADRMNHYDRRPLLVPRDFSAGFIPELLDLDQLFLDSSYRIDISGDRLARVASFPRSHGDAIVLDDVGQFTQDITFKDILMDEPAPTLVAVHPELQLLPLCGTLHAGNCVRDDDLTSTTLVVERGQPIPEPGTGALVALGLGVLGYRRHTSRRAAAG